jgi:hypothetical protein
MNAGLTRAHEAVTQIRALIGDTGWSLFGMGSLGYGNYVPGWSDLDLDIVVADDAVAPADALADRVNDALHASGYADVDVKCFRLKDLREPGLELLYGLANRRVMLADSAVHLHGPDIRPLVPRPGIDELRRECLSVAAGLAEMPDQWWATRPVDDLAAIVALPARLLYTATTGRVVDKTTALEALLSSKQVEARFWAWLSWALACRFSPPARQLPAAAADDARTAGRDLLRWSSARLHALT